MWPLDPPDPDVGMPRPAPVVTDHYRAPRLCPCGCGHEEGYHEVDEDDGEVAA